MLYEVITKYDSPAITGKKVKVSLDIDLQVYGEQLMT